MSTSRRRFIQGALAVMAVAILPAMRRAQTVDLYHDGRLVRRSEPWTEETIAEMTRNDGRYSHGWGSPAYGVFGWLGA